MLKESTEFRITLELDYKKISKCRQATVSLSGLRILLFFPFYVSLSFLEL